MLEYRDVVAALTSLCASFAGAWAAFRFERLRRQQESDEKHVGAGNRAIYTLYHYWNILEQYRKEVLEPYRNKADAWLNLGAHPAAPTATHHFIADELQFLLQASQAEVYATLMLEEQRFYLAVGLIKERDQIVLKEVFPKMARSGIAVGTPIPQEQLESILGIDTTHKLKEITAAIYKNIDEDLESLKSAHEKLRDSMKTLYPKKKFLQIIFQTS